MADFKLNQNILQTATGSITGDIDQLQNAVYGREVRASIAEALYLLHVSGNETKEKSEACLQQLLLVTEKLTELAAQTESDIEAIKRRLGMIKYVYPDVYNTGEITTSVSNLLSEFISGLGSGQYAGSTDQEKWASFADEKDIDGSIFPDVNGDGVIDNGDVTCISSFIAKCGAGEYNNSEDGFMEFMLDYDNAFFGDGILGIRYMTKERYDRLTTKKQGFLYIVEQNGNVTFYFGDKPAQSQSMSAAARTTQAIPQSALVIGTAIFPEKEEEQNG